MPHEPSVSVSRETTFDYVIVGGGSAGCVIAARLSEDPSVRVALVEAGPPDSGRLFEIPALFAQQQKSSFDWDFETDPEAALDQRRVYLPRGRVLGGTSSMNTMVYIRGAARDYDDWARAGFAGWSYEDVLPYFLRAEDNERGANRFHGVGGPLGVSDPRSVNQLIKAWVAAALDAGYPPNEDFNGEDQEGVGVYQMTQRGGLRSSSSIAYLRPAASNRNLTIFSSTQALRIVLQRLRAVGVEVDHLGEVRRLNAEREVVLSAGAYQSPQLLMLSGIGAPEQLKALGIQAVVDLPGVGENLQDHPGAFLSYSSGPTGFGRADTPTNEALLRSEGRGPLTWTEAGGFLRTRPDLSAPDVQFHVALGTFSDATDSQAFDAGVSFGPYVTHPRSRGHVELRSALPYAKPRIIHNYLSEESDRTTLREGLRIAMRVARQAIFQENLRVRTSPADPVLIPRADTDQALDEFIRSTTSSFFHPSGTCAIGAVLDSELRVLGVDGLRVADTSVMPKLIGGNTNAPAIMIGEKAADLIRAAG